MAVWESNWKFVVETEDRASRVLQAMHEGIGQAWKGITTIYDSAVAKIQTSEGAFIKGVKTTEALMSEYMGREAITGVEKLEEFNKALQRIADSTAAAKTLGLTSKQLGAMNKNVIDVLGGIVEVDGALRKIAAISPADLGRAVEVLRRGFGEDIPKKMDKAIRKVLWELSGVDMLNFFKAIEVELPKWVKKGILTGLPGAEEMAIDMYMKMKPEVESEYLIAMENAGKKVHEVIKGVGGVFGLLLKPITAITQPIKTFWQGLNRFKDAVLGTSQATKEAAKAQAEAAGREPGAGGFGGIKKLTQALGGLFKSVGPIALLMESLQPVIDLIKDMLMPLFIPLTDMLMQVIAALQPIVDAIMPVLSKLFEKLTPILVRVAEVLSAALGPVFKAMMPLIEVLAQVFSDLLEAFIPLIEPLTKLLVPVLQLLAPILKVVGAVVTALVKVFSWALGPILEWAGGAIAKVAEAFGGIIKWLQKIPIIGRLFGGVATEQEKQQLAVVTAPIEKWIPTTTGGTAPLTREVVRETIKTIQLPGEGGRGITVLPPIAQQTAVESMDELTRILRDQFEKERREATPDDLVESMDNVAKAVKESGKENRVDPEEQRRINPEVTEPARQGGG